MNTTDKNSIGRNPVTRHVAFDFIRYANCWEDADILCEALQPGPGKRILSIASAGDNALALVAEGAEVVAADLSVPQLACLELRCAGFRRLEHAKLLAFLGIHPADDRLVTYRQIARELSPGALRFWNDHSQLISHGIIHAGKLEAYFRLFRRWVLPLIHSRRTIQRLLEPKDRFDRQRFWTETWNNRRWRLLFRSFFSRRLMGRLGRDPEFFRYVDRGVSEHFMERTCHALTELPIHTNPYLNYIVEGNWVRALPRYLRPEHFDNVRNGLPRLTLYHGSIEQAGQRHRTDGFDGFNLSDIFEYLDLAASRKLYKELVSVAKAGARLAYWNTLVPRRRPTELADRVQPLTELSQALFKRDLAFFYGQFHVDEVGSDQGA